MTTQPNNPTAPPALSAAEAWEENAISVHLIRRGKRRYDEPLVNLTSMVDVLSVLMFFLLSIYSGGGYLSILPSGLELPSSNVRASLTRQVEVAILKDKILVDRQQIADDPVAFTDNEILLLPSLQAALAARGAADPATARVNIEADRSIPFRLLKKVIYTADQAGFRKQSLAVHQVTG
jgi:biopolymer transport protein ExbD